VNPTDKVHHSYMERWCTGDMYNSELFNQTYKAPKGFHDRGVRNFFLVNNEKIIQLAFSTLLVLLVVKLILRYIYKQKYVYTVE